jgi:di/tricarboxylate transporter
MILGVSNEIALVLLILSVTSCVLISSSVRVDLVALSTLVIIGVTGLLPPEKLFSGFSSEAAMSLIGIMIISYGLDNAGITVKIARWIMKFGNENRKKTSLTLLLLSGFMASVLRSVGTVSLFLPVANRISKRVGIPKSSLLMPLAFCALIGGTLTAIGSSPVLILNSLIDDINRSMSLSSNGSYIEKFKLFEILPIGLLLMFVGTLYMMVIMPSLDKSRSKKRKIQDIKDYFNRTYSKGGDIVEIKVLSSCNLIGKCLRDLENEMPRELSVLAMNMSNDMLFPPLRKTQISNGQDIAIMGNKQMIVNFAKSHGLQVKDKLQVFADVLHPTRSGLSESVIPPSSQFIGQEVRELHMRRNHDLHVLALLRGEKVYTGNELDRVMLRAGDTLGMYSKWQSLDEFQEQPDFVVITTSYPRDRRYLTKKIPHALFCFVLTLSLIVTHTAPISVSLLCGAMGMVLTGTVSIDQAYESVSWRTVFLIAGLLPLGIVMQTSGTANWLINHILGHMIDFPTWLIQLLLSLFTTILALVISNVGATIMMVPISISLGAQLGLDPRILSLIVALSACNTFLIPTHQVNALIAGPGGYKVKDFFRYGGVMTILFTATSILGVNWYFS